MDRTERQIFDTLFDNDDTDFKSNLRTLIEQHGLSALNEARDNRLDGLIHRALREDNQDHAKALLEEGLDLSSTDSFGNTPLHLAVALNQSENVALLLEHGADVRTVNVKNGTTPLHDAAEWGDAKLVDTLVDYGAIVDAVNRDGDTPLAIAVNGGGTEKVQRLLDWDADPVLAQQGMGWRLAQATIAQPPSANPRANEACSAVRDCIGKVHVAAVDREQQELRHAMRDDHREEPAQAPARRQRARL